MRYPSVHFSSEKKKNQKTVRLLACHDIFNFSMWKSTVTDTLPKHIKLDNFFDSVDKENIILSSSIHLTIYPNLKFVKNAFNFHFFKGNMFEYIACWCRFRILLIFLCEYNMIEVERIWKREKIDVFSWWKNMPLLPVKWGRIYLTEKCKMFHLGLWCYPKIIKN